MLIAALMTTAQAATYAYSLDIDELSSRADQVIIGEVADTESQWDTNKIVTHVTVHVYETLLGEPTAELTLTLPGGVVGDTRLTIPGTPSLSVGHDVLLFLSEGELVGYGQGVWMVTEGRAIRPPMRPEQADVDALSLEEIRREVR